MKKIITTCLILLVSSQCLAQCRGGAGHLNPWFVPIIESVVPETLAVPTIFRQADSTIIRIEAMFPAYIVPSNDSTWLGTLPVNFLVTEVHCWVKQSFNAIGDDILKIGHVNNKDAYMVETSIGSTGIKTQNHVADGVRIGKYETVKRGVWAYYTYTESNPTAGKAVVFIKGVQVDIEP